MSLKPIRTLGAAYVLILLSEVTQEQRLSENGVGGAVVVGELVFATVRASVNTRDMRHKMIFRFHKVLLKQNNV